MLVILIGILALLVGEVATVFDGPAAPLVIALGSPATLPGQSRQ